MRWHCRVGVECTVERGQRVMGSMWEKRQPIVTRPDDESEATDKKWHPNCRVAVLYGGDGRPARTGVVME